MLTKTALLTTNTLKHPHTDNVNIVDICQNISYNEAINIILSKIFLSAIQKFTNS